MAAKKTPRLVPGTSVPVVRKYGNYSFLVKRETIAGVELPEGYRATTIAVPHLDADTYREHVWLTARPMDAYSPHSSVSEAELAKAKAALTPVVVEPDDRHRREYSSAALAAICEGEIAKINADYERAIAPKRPRAVQPRRVTNPNYEAFMLAREAKPVAPRASARSAPKPAAAPVEGQPKHGTPEWKRMIRKLYREHTGRSAPSITRDVIGSLRTAGLVV